MEPMSRTAGPCGRFVAAAASCGLMVAAGPAVAEGCAFEPQGEGRVAAVIDACSFLLDDGREVVLASIEPVGNEKSKNISALSAVVAGCEVTLSGQDCTPDRYGRQAAFTFLGSVQPPVQAHLLAQGAALLSGSVTDRDGAALLAATEATGRDAKQGIWADPSAIKNAESPGDILAGIGRFTVIEGKAVSVRQAGAATYLNFGRSWTRDFAVTISRRMLPAFGIAGIVLKSLENKRIRVRGGGRVADWAANRSAPCGAD